MEEFKRLLARVAAGERLDVESARAAFDAMMAGNATPSQMGGFLMCLRVRGETVDEITGGALALRARALKLTAPKGAIDIVGTGGDATGTYNISTCTSFVVAGCGVPVAKHGNRALSSKSGAADALTSLGVNLDCAMPLIERAMREANIGFMLAPRHHGAMRAVGPTRVELGTRTIVNLLGPLANPADTRRQLIGVFGREWVRPVAETMGKLGAERVWVVHGSDGMDEITTTGVTYAAELNEGTVTEFELTPEQAGLPRATFEDLRGADPETNAAAIRNVLAGATGPLRDIVLFNAAAALIVAGKVSDLKAGVAMAAQSIDTGRAKAALDKLVAITNSPPPQAGE
jgi:anthranilate phosphoribosyltransferase